MLQEQQAIETKHCPVEVEYATNLVVGLTQTGDMGPTFEVPLSYQTPKTVGGRKSKAEGRTLLARFAIHLGLSHTKLDAYLNGSSGFGPNDDSALNEIGVQVVQHFQGRAGIKNASQLVAEIAKALHAYGNPPTTEVPTTTDESKTLLALDFGGEEAPVATTIVADDGLSSLVPAAATATATEAASTTGVLLDSWADFEAVVPTLNATKADGDALIQAFFFENTRSNGRVARVERGGRKDHTVSRMKTQLGWDNPIQNASLHIVADALRISPKRKVGDKMRSFFFQLTDTSDDNKNANRLWVCQLITAHLIRESGRKHYTSRFAGLVSERFVDEATAKLGISTAKRDSAVVGGTAKSWTWKYDTTDWKSKGSVEVADITADTFSLSNL